MTQTPTENPVLVLMARAILARSYGPGRVPDLESRDTRAWREALADAQAAFSVLPVEKGSDSAGRSERPQEASPEGWLTIESAPLSEPGHIWGPGLADVIGATGSIYAYDDESRGVSSPWRGMKFTHWHPFPKPPAASKVLSIALEAPSVVPSAPLSEPIDFPSNNTEGERL